MLSCPQPFIHFEMILRLTYAVSCLRNQTLWRSCYVSESLPLATRSSRASYLYKAFILPPSCSSIFTKLLPSFQKHVVTVHDQFRLLPVLKSKGYGFMLHMSVSMISSSKSSLQFAMLRSGPGLEICAPHEIDKRGNEYKANEPLDCTIYIRVPIFFSLRFVSFQPFFTFFPNPTRVKPWPVSSSVYL